MIRRETKEKKRSRTEGLPRSCALQQDSLSHESHMKHSSHGGGELLRETKGHFKPPPPISLQSLHMNYSICCSTPLIDRPDEHGDPRTRAKKLVLPQLLPVVRISNAHFH